MQVREAEYRGDSNSREKLVRSEDKTRESLFFQTIRKIGELKDRMVDSIDQSFDQYLVNLGVKVDNFEMNHDKKVRLRELEKNIKVNDESSLSFIFKFLKDQPTLKSLFSRVDNVDKLSDETKSKLLYAFQDCYNKENQTKFLVDGRFGPQTYKMLNGVAKDKKCTVSVVDPKKLFYATGVRGLVVEKGAKVSTKIERKESPVEKVESVSMFGKNGEIIYDVFIKELFKTADSVVLSKFEKIFDSPNVDEVVDKFFNDYKHTVEPYSLVEKFMKIFTEKNLHNSKFNLLSFYKKFAHILKKGGYKYKKFTELCLSYKNHISEYPYYSVNRNSIASYNSLLQKYGQKGVAYNKAGDDEWLFAGMIGRDGVYVKRDLFEKKMLEDILG